MFTKKSKNRSRLKEYLETMRFLSAGSDASLYIYDIVAGRVYFADSFDEKYHLPPMIDDSYSISELMGFLRRRDVAAERQELRDLPEEIRRLSHSEYWLTNESGDSILLNNEIRVEYSDSGKPIWVIGRLRDTAAGRNMDSLTGLLDAEKMMEDLKHCRQNDGRGYLMVLGIDNFRDINTRHGRGFGNQIIKAVAEILEEEAADSGVVYRLDSDKFAVHISGGSRETVEGLYSRFQKHCAHICTLSAGAAEYADKREDMDEIYQQAENALNLAKQQGKNMLLFYSSAVFEQRLSMLDLQEELRNSASQGFAGFFLTYQPQIRCGSFELFGAEALLRFRSPSRGLVRPDEFMSILEQSGLIVEVGDWILETALNQCRIWREQIPQMHISINMSYIQLRQRGVADRILQIVERSGVPGSAVTLELTESMQLQDFQRFNKIFYKLEKSGIQIAIDDFGTGYSSLSYLKRIAIDEIKIDRCFVSRIQHSIYNYRLLSNMIELARSAQIRICCEGVETEEELAVLRELNPDLLQGYLFAKPCEPEQFEARYLKQDSEEYIQCRRQEEYYRSQEKIFDTESMERSEQERRSAIVDGMEELVYVRSLDSYELLYLNAAGREMTGIYDYKGCKCYKVLVDRDAPCEGCSARVLSSEDYHVWEKQNSYLNRHYILKEKLIPWNGKIAGLCVGIDVTEREITSMRVQEKLEFEKNIVDSTQMLLNERDIHTAISNLLRSIGTFYRAGRAYLFELQDNGQYWDNTYEWCDEGVEPQIEYLQDVPLSVTKRWLEVFQSGECVIIENLDDIRETAPEEWEILKPQKVKNLIVAPVWRDRQVVGFIGVDNPRAHVRDCGQVQTISCFLADRLVKDATKNRLNELLNLHYEDILKTTRLGLWVIRLSKDGTRGEMYVDQTMRNVLGLRGELSAEECYRYWYDRISEGYFHYVSFSVQHMIDTGKPVELCYTWNHPVKGETTVRCLGIRVADMGDMICLEGYHREINEVDMPRFLPDAKSIIFEYNENKHSVYFHNSRAALAGSEEKEENFPDCWLDSGMVHPHFAWKFRSLFTDIHSQPEQDEQEFLLKSAGGYYDWFKLKTRHLGSSDQDMNTMIVILDPATQERAMELEFMRQKDFYHASLSEKIAYAEIDMESKRFLTVGGLWAEYIDDVQRSSTPYDTVLLKHTELLVHPEDQQIYRDFIHEDTLHRLLRQGKTTDKLQFRRLINGAMRWVELSGHVFQDQLTENNYALLYMKDIDAEKRHELERELAATRDPLTKVFNRNTFEEEVTRHILESKTNTGTLLLIDMDHFKEINDSYGHTEGDTILRKTSDILMSTFRRKDLIGRFGGDEFLVFLKNVTDRAVINRRLTELRDMLSDVDGHMVTCSIGAVEVRRENFSYDRSLHQADIAMYRSKELGRNTFCFYEDMSGELSRQ